MFGGFVLMRMPIVDGWAEGKGSGIEVIGSEAYVCRNEYEDEWYENYSSYERAESKWAMRIGRAKF